MMNKIMNFLREEDGLTMIEYAVAGGLITLGAVAAFTGLGEAITGKVEAISAKVSE